MEPGRRDPGGAPDRQQNSHVNDFSLEAMWTVLDASAGGAESRRYCIAFSGGMDSMVLLVGMARMIDRFQPDALRAAHVHHGLHAQADAWAEACRTQCEALGIPLTVLRVDARPARGESPEARAREVRYAALGDALAPGEVLLTAHHADDQLETVLIQLLRGAGVAGLAAMPVETPFGAGWHQRPLLGFPRASLQAWAQSQRLPEWVRDPANEQPRFARNHLRHEVLPAIRAHWPGAAAAASRSARHCAEAASLLEEFAALDAAGCVEGEALSVPGMRQLSAARCRNLVRWQCRQLGLPVPDERRLASLLAQVFEAAPDTHPEIRWPGVVATRHADGLWLMPEAGLSEVPGPLAWPDPSAPLALGPGLGRLAIEPTTGGGLRRDALASAPWRVVFRTGGERLQLPGRAGHQSLKNLLQAAGIPPWIRSRIPLLEVAGKLAAVGDLWIDQSWWAPPDTEGWRLRWEDCALPGRGAFIVGGQPF